MENHTGASGISGIDPSTGRCMRTAAESSGLIARAIKFDCKGKNEM